MTNIFATEEVKRKLAPWEENPYGVVSLLAMLKFWADFFVEAIFELDSMAERWLPNDNVIPAPAAVAGKLSALQLQCAEHGLETTAMACVRIMDKSHTKMVTYREIVGDLKHLRETLVDELRKTVFLHLDPQEGRLYEKPDKDWQSPIQRFPKVRHDIEESSKCYALGRYAAAVFHVMLVAEYGIIQVSELFGVAGDRPGWGALDRLQRINDKAWDAKTPLEQEHAKFLENLLPLAFAMKESWRHKMDHVANKIEWMDTTFDPELANDIISATRGFMRRLANDLPK